MLSYLKCLFCLLAVTSYIEIESKYLDFNRVGQHYYNYQIINGNMVDLKVYYESLCPDCISFHTGALHDTYKKIGSYIDLKTYPYGNAKRTQENGKTIITCQHGPNECYGNKLHACAIDILKNVSRSEFFDTCMMQAQWGGRGSTDMDATNKETAAVPNLKYLLPASLSYQPTPLRLYIPIHPSQYITAEAEDIGSDSQCGQLMDIDSKPIIECAKSKRGEDLLEYYGKETDKLTNKTFVPWILLNGKFFDSDKEDLMKKICEALDNPPPPCGQ